MEEQFCRTELLLGSRAMGRLAQSRVAVFGIGGVGGYVVEALVRSGIGAIDLIDHDRVSLSNLNRQIIATRETVGKNKVEIMRERILSIHPDCKVTAHQCFYLPETAEQFHFSEYSYVVDAIDTVTGKIQLILQAQEAGIPVISCMGTGNKLNPMELKVADLYETTVCPLAKVMRKELKRRGVKQLKVVYSPEKPIPVRGAKEILPENGQKTEDSAIRQKPVPGSVSFVPSVAGLILASEVMKDLIADDLQYNLSG